MGKIEMTVEDLRHLLNEQKKMTIEKCMSHSYFYNTESTDGKLIPLSIDKDKFTKHGMSTEYPNDFLILDKYVKK